VFQFAEVEKRQRWNLRRSEIRNTRKEDEAKRARILAGLPPIDPEKAPKKKKS
jgi:hypothetical protein